MFPLLAVICLLLVGCGNQANEDKRETSSIANEDKAVGTTPDDASPSTDIAPAGTNRDADDRNVSTNRNGRQQNSAGEAQPKKKRENQWGAYQAAKKNSKPDYIDRIIKRAEPMIVLSDEQVLAVRKIAEEYDIEALKKKENKAQRRSLMKRIKEEVLTEEQRSTVSLFY